MSNGRRDANWQAVGDERHARGEDRNWGGEDRAHRGAPGWRDEPTGGGWRGEELGAGPRAAQRYGRPADSGRGPEHRVAQDAGRQPRGGSMWPGPERGREPPGRGDRGFLDRAGDEVASWFGDEAAERRREADHRGKGPKGYVRSDDRIAEDVNDRLGDDPYLDATDISVSVAGGEVTLAGEVESRADKRRAEDVVDAVSGVRHVQNNLRVRAAR